MNNNDIPHEVVLQIGGRQKVSILLPGKHSVYDPDTRTYYLYIGYVDSINSVPEINCIYRIGDSLFKRKINGSMMLKESQKKGIRKKKKDESRLLNVKVKDDDDLLMILAKDKLLKDMSVQHFKDLFGENVIDMNNMRHAIEKSNTLTWKRFALLADLVEKEISVSVMTDD